MRQRSRWRGMALLLLACAAPARAADVPPQVAVRLGEHPDFVRLTFSWPEAPGYTLAESEGRVELRFGPVARLDFSRLAARPPRHVRSLQPLEDGVVLELQPGARVRHRLIGQSVALEILAPPGTPRVAAARAHPAPPAAPAPAPAQQAEPKAPPGQVSAPAAPLAAARAAPVTAAQDPGQASPPLLVRHPESPHSDSQSPSPGLAPVAPAASAEPATPAPAAPPPAASAIPPAGPPSPAPRAPAALRLAFPSGTGAVVLARGDRLLLVFDAVREVDAAALRGLAPGLGTAEAETQRGATVVRLPLAAADAAGLRLAAGPGGWTLTTEAGAAQASPAEIKGDMQPGPAPRLLLPAEGAGRVVTLPDPASDGLLLLGTLTGPPATLHRPVQHAGFELLPTRLGVAIHPQSDEVTLRPQREGFVVSSLRPPAAPALPDAPPLPALLDLPDLPQADLLARRRQALADTAAAGPQARGLPRLALGEALLALGLGAEAQGMAQMAVEEDPRLAGQPRTLLLLGAAPLLAGRVAEAEAALSDPRLDQEPEALLWRALTAAITAPPGPETAGPIAAGAGTLRHYPLSLRARLLPAAAEALIATGRSEEASSLLQDAALAGLPRFALAQARLLEAQERTEAALAAYALLARSRDQDVRARALQRAAELRLATGRDDARRAAAALEAAFIAWRGDERELALRLRVAELRHQAGQPSEALALLEETETLFPEAAPRIHALMTGLLPAALTDPAMPLAEAARLAERKAGLLPATEEATGALAALATRLADMELPAQAAVLLRQAVALSPKAELRAPLALRLATILLAAGEPTAAREALRDAPAEALPAALRGERGRLEAEALRRSGDSAGAAMLLRSLGEEGLPVLADLLAEQEDWAGAARALAEQAEHAIPPAPAPLDLAQRQLLLRLAAYAGLAGDEARVAALRQAYAGRLAGGPLAEAFAAVVGNGARQAGPPDLPRLRQEVQAARALQEQLRSVR